jgi:SAM-dependent methyltransferase
MMKMFYEVVYQYFRAPWDIGARRELVSLVESGRIEPCRAIDLGCGAGANAIYLAQKGFEVTGVDYANAAIETARKRAMDAGVAINFIVDDLTNLQNVTGKFDFLLDYGVLDDLRRQSRDLYLQNMLPLTRRGSRYMLWGFEYPLRWWEQLIPFFDLPFKQGEIEDRFGPYFGIERIAGEVDWSKSPSGYAAYLMTRIGETQ